MTLATLVAPAVLWLGCAPDLRVAEPPGAGGAGGSASSNEGGSGTGGAGAHGALIWAASFGGEGDQAAIAVAAGTMGDLVVVGELGGRADFGDEALESAGSDDIFITWLDAGGQVERALRVGDANPQEVSALARTDDGGAVIAGAMSGTIQFGADTWTSAGGRDGYVAKLDRVGTPVWGLRFGDAGYQAVTGLSVDVAGNVLLTGVISGAFTLANTVPSAGGYDLLVAKLSAEGTPLWSRSFGGALDQRAHGMATDSTGGAVVVGELAGSMAVGGEVVTSAGAEDVLVLKVGAGGDALWARHFGDAKEQVARCVAVDRAGRSILGGEFAGSLDFGGGPLVGSGVGGVFVAALDANGEHVWSLGFAGSGATRLTGLAVDQAGDVVITGVLAGSLEIGGQVLVSEGQEDVFAARMDTNGKMLWAQRLGDSGLQRGHGVTIDGEGEVVIAGNFNGAIETGAGLLESAGGHDAMLLKLSR